MGLYREWSKSVYLQHGMTENRIKTMDYIFLKLLQDGNMGAWHRLYKQYWSRVHGFVSGMVPEKWAVDEIVQNVFVKIWTNRSRIAPDKASGDGLSGYMFMISRNEVMDWYRHRAAVMKFRKELAEELSEEFVQRDMTDYCIITEIIDRTVASMPSTRREIFISSRYFGRSNKDTASRLGISIRTVEKHINLAIRQIKHELASALKINVVNLSLFLKSD